MRWASVVQRLLHGHFFRWEFCHPWSANDQKLAFNIKSTFPSSVYETLFLSPICEELGSERMSYFVDWYMNWVGEQCQMVRFRSLYFFNIVTTNPFFYKSSQHLTSLNTDECLSAVDEKNGQGNLYYFHSPAAGSWMSYEFISDKDLLLVQNERPCHFRCGGLVQSSVLGSYWRLFWRASKILEFIAFQIPFPQLFDHKYFCWSGW